MGARSRFFTTLLVVLGASTACSSTPSETSLEECSNARDDDGDGAIDCRDLACSVYAFCARTPNDAGVIDAGPRPDGALCAKPLDLVLVLDVSSSMAGALGALREALPSLLSEARQLDPEARVSAIQFVDDVQPFQECGGQSDADLALVLEAALAQAASNRSPVSGTVNVECAENALDALVEGSRCSGFRPGSTRIVLLMTDDTFAERPTVLSGPYGGGVVVQHSYAQTVAALTEAGVHILALTRTGAGRPCGAARVSADVGAGFHSPFEGSPSLPEATTGTALDLDAWLEGSGSVDLPRALRELALGHCN